MAILKFLAGNASGYTTIDRIAEATGAGTRTIYRDLEHLERSLRPRGLRLERRRGYGIRLADPLPDTMVRDLAIMAPEDRLESGQRPSLIFFYLVLSGDWVKLASLAGALFVSDSTISLDLNALEAWLPPSIMIDRQKGTGVRLRGSERDIRFLFLSTFPSLFPHYLIDGDAAGGRREERFLGALNIGNRRKPILERIAEAESVLGLSISHVHNGLLSSYLLLMDHRLEQGSGLVLERPFRLDIPDVYMIAAGELRRDAPESERVALGAILAACDAVQAPESSVSVYLGNLEPYIESMIEHSLGRLEGKERIWLHDDRKFLNYMRLVIAAAAHRIDMGVSEWRKYRLTPFPEIHETPESAILVSQFLADLGALLGEPDPAVVRREIREAALAVAARLEKYRHRTSNALYIRILCYEGLGTANYILALARDVFPSGTMFNNQWDPDFAADASSADYDLVITTCPLYVRGGTVLKIDGNDPSEQIREVLREAASGLAGPDDSRMPRRPPSAQDTDLSETGFSLTGALRIVHDLRAVARDPSIGIFRQTAEVLDRGDCDLERLTADFERRESYGRLEFDEFGIRVLHCRSDAIPAPRAGVIQGVGEGTIHTYLLLSAPLKTGQNESFALSEIVIALTEVPKLPEVLRRGSREEIQNVLTDLISQSRNH